MHSDLLDALFTEGEIINVRGFGAPNPTGNFSTMLPYGDDDQLRTQVERAQSQLSNSGFGVAVRRSAEGNGGQGNLLHSRALWVDVDDPEITLETLDERAMLAGYPAPTIVVSTGGGAHCYWCLDTPAPLHTLDERGDFKKRLQILSKAMSGDPKCAEPARIMRIPGTVNMKRPGRYETHMVCSRSTTYPIHRFPDKDLIIRSGERNNAIFQEAVRQRNLSVPRDAAYDVIWAMNEVCCRPPLSPEEVGTTVSSAYNRETGAGAPGVRFPEAIEREIAISFIRDRGDNLKYEEGLGWLLYNGKYWGRDENEALNMVGAYINLLRIRAGEAGGAQERLSSLCSRSLTYRKIKDILALSSTVRECRIKAEDFDNDPMKVNFQNCTLTFSEDGEFSQGEHNRDDHLTNVLPSNYTQGCSKPEGFLKFLNEIFNEDAEVIRYLQKRLGSCLLGNVGDSKALIMFGDGANGKSVLAGILQGCLGEYCFPVPASTLTGGEGGETKVASLQGKRVGLVHEFGSNTQLNDERFKMLTGGEALISGRHLYGRHFSFRPVTSFLIMSNYLPTVNDMSHGLWRRMALIHFPVIIPEHEQERGLMRRLVDSERDQIMSWLIEGTQGFFQEGLEEPEACRAALEDYKDSEDVISVFLHEKYEPFTSGRVRISKVYEAFTEWCRRRGQKPGLNINNFGRLSHGRMIGEGENRCRIDKGKKGGDVYLFGITEKQEERISWMD
jgi:P4 family phage/plasmid primase-like protien